MFRILQRSKLQSTNLNSNSALMHVFDVMDTEHNRELTFGQLKAGMSSAVLNMHWSDSQCASLFKVNILACVLVCLGRGGLVMGHAGGGGRAGMGLGFLAPSTASAAV